MRLVPRIAIVVSVLMLVASILGFVAVLILNSFVLDKYDAYGEVPVPGSSRLHLPEGEVTVSFHTVVTGRPASGFPIPNLQFTIVPPDGVAEPQVTESIGGTTTVNNDTHVRVWVVRIAAEGDYKIQTGGNVNGYISPRLAFGHDSSLSVLLWVFGALFVAGLLGLFAGLVWSARVGKKARPLESYEFPPMSAPQSNPSSVPGDQGIRLEQLRQLAALRDSGALTEEEYTAEKRRILDN
jgi:hypothetical protein